MPKLTFKDGFMAYLGYIAAQFVVAGLLILAVIITIYIVKG